MTIPFGQCLCECGKPYCPTRDGRWNHQHIFGHVPTLEVVVAPPPPPLIISVRCENQSHGTCKGICYRNDLGERGRRVCECACHEKVGEGA